MNDDIKVSYILLKLWHKHSDQNDLLIELLKEM
jgi:hypothetical protein